MTWGHSKAGKEVHIPNGSVAKRRQPDPVLQRRNGPASGAAATNVVHAGRVPFLDAHNTRVLRRHPHLTSRWLACVQLWMMPFMSRYRLSISGVASVDEMRMLSCNTHHVCAAGFKDGERRDDCHRSPSAMLCCLVSGAMQIISQWHHPAAHQRIALAHPSVELGNTCAPISAAMPWSTG